MEVSAAAANAEDAGLLQYSKTLDSLETKLNNLSTSFQQFYMSLANGETFGGAIEGITKFIEGLNKLGNFSAIANIAGIISSLRLVGKTAVNNNSRNNCKNNSCKHLTIICVIRSYELR